MSTESRFSSAKSSQNDFLRQSSLKIVANVPRFHNTHTKSCESRIHETRELPAINKRTLEKQPYPSRLLYFDYPLFGIISKNPAIPPKRAFLRQLRKQRCHSVEIPRKDLEPAGSPNKESIAGTASLFPGDIFLPDSGGKPGNLPRNASIQRFPASVAR